MSALREELLGYLDSRGLLLTQGHRWMRVSGSTVAHLMPPTILRRSTTACARLQVYDAAVELLGEVRRCAGCLRWAQ